MGAAGVVAVGAAAQNVDAAGVVSTAAESAVRAVVASASAVGAAAQNLDAAGVVGAAAQAVVEAVGAAVAVVDAGAAAQAGAVAAL